VAVGIDVVTENVRTLTTSPQTFTHAAGASGVKHVVLTLIRNGTGVTAIATAASYGGDALTQLATQSHTTSEAATVEVWHGAVASNKQGSQTVSYTCGTTGDDIQAVAITFTSATSKCRVFLTSMGANASLANPGGSVTLANDTDTLSGYGIIAMFSGAAAPTNLTDAANQTRLHDHDFGQQVCVVSRTTNVQSADYTMGYTAAADDVCYMMVHVSESIYRDSVSAGSSVPGDTLAATLPAINQDTWRCSESAATWKAAAAADVTINTASDATARLRFALSCSAGGRSNFQPVLQRAYYSAGGDTFKSSIARSAGLVIEIVGNYSLLVGQAVLHNVDVGDTRAFRPGLGGGLASLLEFPIDGTTGQQVNDTTSASAPITGRSRIHSAHKIDLNSNFLCGTSTTSPAATYIETLTVDAGGWDLSSGLTLASSLSIDGAVQNDVTGITANGAYSKFYALTNTSSGVSIRQYDTSSNIASATLTSTYTASTDDADIGLGLWVNDNGTLLKFCIWDNSASTWYLRQLVLSTAWALSTASLDVEYVMSEVASSDEVTQGGKYSANATDYYYNFWAAAGQVYYAPTAGYLWENVTTTTPKVRAFDSTNVVHAADTTQQISTGTFITPNSGISETGTAGVDNDIDFTANTKVEVEYAIKLTSADTTDAEEIRFRIGNVDTWSSV
jgi:hypothetical protein